MIKIFSYPWHTAHQHELCKIPNTKFYYFAQGVRSWGTSARPFPKNLEYVNYFDPKKYDLAILHTDQAVLDHGPGKSALFTQTLETVSKSDIPIIVVNHGTPYEPESWQEVGMEEKDHMELIAAEVKKILKPVDHVIVNSHKAKEQWGMGDVIWHGMNPDEWKPEVKEPRAVVSIGPRGWDKYYNRKLLTEVKTQLKAKLGYKTGVFHCMVDAEFPSQEAYSKFIGSSLVYFNPTYQSCMPRARTEAMHAGCCVVTTKYHDADMFIENGKNGFIVPDNPTQIANLLVELLSPYRILETVDKVGNRKIEMAKSRYTYDQVVKIGEEGRKTAQKEFHIDRFTQEWTKTIDQVLKGKGNNV